MKKVSEIAEDYGYRINKYGAVYDSHDLQDAFIDGYNEAKKDTIEKACKWLTDIFRKAMEEEK